MLSIHKLQVSDHTCITGVSTCTSYLVCLCVILTMASTGSMQPTLMQLTCLRLPSMVDGENKRLNIVQRTASHYAKLAMHLLDDENRVITAILEVLFHHNPERIATDVYEKWISGTGRKPISWRTLIDVLREIGLISLAEEIETALEH